jgi:hypothetical protein
VHVCAWDVSGVLLALQYVELLVVFARPTTVSQLQVSLVAPWVMEQSPVWLVMVVALECSVRAPCYGRR